MIVWSFSRTPVIKQLRGRCNNRARHEEESCPRGFAEPQRNSNADYANAPPPAARRDGSPLLGGTYGGTSGAAGGRTTPPFSRAGSPRSQDSAPPTWHLCHLPFANNCQLQIVDNCHLRPCVPVSLRPCVFLSRKVRKVRKVDVATIGWGEPHETAGSPRATFP